MNPIRANRSLRTQPAVGGPLRALPGLALVLTIAVSGCSMFNSDSGKPEPDALSNVIGKIKESGNSNTPLGRTSGKISEKVKLAGGLSLGETENLAFTPQSLGQALVELIDQEKWNSSRSLLGLYPDIVTRILMNDGGYGLTSKQITTIAKLFDKRWNADGQGDWASLVNASALNGNTKEFLRLRMEFLRQLEENNVNGALDLNLLDVLGKRDSTLARAEALRLEGIAYLMTGDHRRSTEYLATSVQMLESSHPYLASQTGLLLGEALRHAGETEAWKSSWTNAVVIQSRWIADRELSDPAFWRKAAFLRPNSQPWPSSVIRRLEHSLRNQNLEFGSDQTMAEEAVVWATVGIQSLKRHESQNAILAFKKSEALVTSSSLKSELQMQQALAMIDGGQQGPASAILLRLSSQSNLLSDRAKAILATLKLQNGSLAQGMNLLQSAIKTANQWPTSERLRAQADYGLAYLMLGREEQGIALLNQVHAEFIKLGSYDHAAQCLVNIATYYDKTDQRPHHRTAVARLKELETF